MEDMKLKIQMDIVAVLKLAMYGIDHGNLAGVKGLLQDCIDSLEAKQEDHLMESNSAKTD